MKKCFLIAERPFLLLLTIVLNCTCVVTHAQSSQSASHGVVRPTDDPSAGKVLLPNGWTLSPAGRSLPLGDLPLNMALSHNKQYLAVTNNGQGKQTIDLINPKTERLIDSISIGKAWYGIRFSEDDDRLYVSGGNDNIILSYKIENHRLKVADTFRLGKPWPKEKISPTGIDVDNKKNLLYTVTKEDSSLYIYDITERKTVNRIRLGHEAYACQLSPDKNRLYISLWGGAGVTVYNTKTQTIETTIPTGNHPNELLLTHNGKFLFVANANDNTVSIINTLTEKVIETISSALYPTSLAGSTTNGLGLSPDEKTLYIANADNNCLAVFDVSTPGKSTSKGFIPTGWYPTNIKTLGKKIFVSNGKGFSSLPNPEGPQPVRKTDNSGQHQGITGPSKVQYIAALMKGTLSIIDAPSESQLNNYSKQVYANTPFKGDQQTSSAVNANNLIPSKNGTPGPIKHVFYIIKENRTYDQVLGDMKEGNGDTSLCIFGEKVTPNHHALAREFVLLDNFYVDAEVSADGHNWSMAAYATDYVEKTWPISYGSRGGTYDYEGSRKVAYPRDGFIWDYCKRAGISYRTYGEFGSYGKANIKALEGHVCPGYPGFDLDFRDIDRVAIFKHDFDSLLAINQVPQFNTVRISNDHTSGQKKGKISPISAVADNDLAVGRFVQIISESPIWKESVIFILEDDAQNGPDHIDAHRSPAFVISPYIKKGQVNHTMYSTSGVLHTIELLLGLPPMSQYDAAALPLFSCFTNQPDTGSYRAKDARVSLEERNGGTTASAKRSELFNLAKEDAVPDLELNEVIWKYVKGEHSVMPAPRRSAFVKLEQRKDEDD